MKEICTQVLSLRASTLNDSLFQENWQFWQTFIHSSQSIFVVVDQTAQIGFKELHLYLQFKDFR